MELELWRYRSDSESTLGLLMLNEYKTRKLLCHTCEDAYHGVKMRGITRIPEGRYEIKLRQEGGMHSRYRVSSHTAILHRGMLWLQDVPGFDWIYLHIGNDEDDTQGCILVGENCDQGRLNIQSSVSAYQRIYPIIAEATGASTYSSESPGAWITVRDLDRLPPPLF